MTRCVIAVAVITYLLAVFQATLGARLAIAGVPPDLLFVWTVCLGLAAGPKAGGYAGFGSGLLEGALRQALIGSLAISRGLTGLAAGFLATKLSRDNWAVPVLAAASLTIANEAIQALLAGPSGWALAGRLVGGRIIYHAVLTPILLALVLRARRAMTGSRAEVT
jgi:rod shape-determining protein MreD